MLIGGPVCNVNSLQIDPSMKGKTKYVYSLWFLKMFLKKKKKKIFNHSRLKSIYFFLNFKRSCYISFDNSQWVYIEN